MRLDLLPNSTPPGRDRIDEFFLREWLAIGGCLKVLVGYAKIGVPRDVSDHELMYAHFCQHGAYRVANVCQPTPVIAIFLNVG